MGLFDEVLIRRDSLAYPPSLAGRLADDSPPQIFARGDASVLSGIDLALICSVSCPGSVILATIDAIRAISRARLCVVGGFHSPIERECLRFLVHGDSRVVWSPASGLAAVQLEPAAEQALARHRLALVSRFDAAVMTATPESARLRNDLVCAMAPVLFVPHARRAGEAERALRRTLNRGQTVVAFGDPSNSHLSDLGVQLVTPFDTAATMWALCSRRAAEPRPPGQGRSSTNAESRLPANKQRI